ncbi:MAG: hypothetical protein GTN89_05625 [Acidobacteria bacterium]|nr:hypothetical protein [Acidobacteriota bacterium]NIM61368.1 hypothetical protein [Acidobacteriota bacterium]NIO58803.1 hypothetical protein [Acidobacteriota bacterium]NIQ29847.1 hypothetical protein [Acidobacteriota bacterium]NIQ84580.1 hypothetical protein [Acidobacteriota bacterium]
MTEAAPAGKGCFKRGCFGCLGVLGVGLIVVMVIALITLIRGTPEVVRESDQVAHDIPSGDWGDAATGEPLMVEQGQLGRVVLDISVASFRIIPAPAGTPVRLEANYDSGTYRLKERFEPSGELGWTYRLEFGKRSSFDFFTVDPDNRLDLYLPAGTPISLEGDLGIGQFKLELGGLWIDSVNLDTGVGEHQIEFDEPLVAAMKEFNVDGSIGELSVRGLGNASPANAHVDHSIGEVFVDLRGAWQNDSEIYVGSSIGECRVNLPSEGVGVVLRGGSVTLGESDTRRARSRGAAPEGAPVLQITARHTIGELRFTE